MEKFVWLYKAQNKFILKQFFVVHIIFITHQRQKEIFMLIR